MKGPRGALLALSLAGALVGVRGLAAPASARAAAPVDVVQAPGGPFLTDQYGRDLEFHGMNLVPECVPHTKPDLAAPGEPCVYDPDGDDPGQYVTPDAPDPGFRFTDADAQTLHAAGIDLVRLGIHWEALEPGSNVGPNDPRYCRQLTPGESHDPSLGAAVWNPSVADAYLAHVDAEIAILARHGIRVLIDMHSGAYGAYFHNSSGATPWIGSGAPLWATCTDGTDNPAIYSPPAAWNSSYFSVPVETALDHFWSNDVAVDLQAEYIRVWKYVATHYAHSPYASDIIGYELANEPVDESTIPTQLFDRKLQCDYAGSAYAPQSCAASIPATHAEAVGMIPAIQSVDPDHTIFYEPPQLVSEIGGPETIGTAEKLPFKNLALSFHIYSEGSQGDDWVTSSMASSRAATQTEQPGGPAWLLTEFGATSDPTAVGQGVQAADQNLVSWTFWAALQLHDPTGNYNEHFLDTNTRQPVYPMACQLMGAHPQAVAGTPTGQSYDPSTGAMTSTWTPNPKVTAPTVIDVPPLRYGEGYTVKLSGGRVTSSPDAQQLTIANLPGASSVSLTITPLDAACPNQVKPAAHPQPAASSYCPPPTGGLHGRMLGLLRLGMTRAQARRVYTNSSTRGKHYQDFFCLTPIGIRVGYASPKLLRSLPTSRREKLRNRIVLILTANPFYSLGGARPDTPLRAVKRRLRIGRGFHVGGNWWYFAPGGANRGVLKVRHGVIEEIGIADKALTQSRQAQRHFITSFY